MRRTANNEPFFLIKSNSGWFVALICSRSLGIKWLHLLMLCSVVHCGIWSIPNWSDNFERWNFRSEPFGAKTNKLIKYFLVWSGRYNWQIHCCVHCDNLFHFETIASTTIVSWHSNQFNDTEKAVASLCAIRNTIRIKRNGFWCWQSLFDVDLKNHRKSAWGNQ